MGLGKGIFLKRIQCLRFEVPTTLVVKISIFWDITPRSLLKVNQYFGGTCYLLHVGFLSGLFVNPEDGRGMFVLNVD
jgi:hypothetical protein